jgi:hypothetical protein
VLPLLNRLGGERLTEKKKRKKKKINKRKKKEKKEEEHGLDAPPQGRRDLHSSGMLSRVWWSGQPIRSKLKGQEIQDVSR